MIFITATFSQYSEDKGELKPCLNEHASNLQIISVKPTNNKIFNFHLKSE